MPAVEVDSASYWSAVAASVPVFALALVLEVRRGASRWAQADTAYRIFGALGAVLYAVVLYVLFSKALTALVVGEGTTDAWWVNGLLTFLLSAAVVNPLIDVALRGTSDVWARLWALVPVSRVGRVKRQGWAVRRHYVTLRRRACQNIRRAQRGLRQAQRLRREIEERERRWGESLPKRLAALAERAARGEVDSEEVRRQHHAADEISLVTERFKAKAVSTEAEAEALFRKAREVLGGVEASALSADKRIAEAVKLAMNHEIAVAEAMLVAARQDWKGA